MEEVVAKRHNAAGAAYIFVTIIGVLLVVLGSIVGAKSEEPMGALLLCLVVGGIIIIMGVYSLVRFFRIPSKAVVFKDGVLYFPHKLTCRPEELQDVSIKIYKNGRSGAVSRYGKLLITVGGRQYKFNDIAKVADAQLRLLEINKEAIDALNRPEPQSEEAVPSSVPEEDPFADMGN